jgi:glycosyltransferase involved in cell wall biosynthesis
MIATGQRASDKDGVPTAVRTLQALNVTSHVDLRHGGICVTMPEFSRALNATGRWRTSTVALADDDEISTYQSTDGKLVRLPRGRLRWMREPALKRQLAAQIEAADIVHVQGLWDEHSVQAYALSRRLKKPYIVSAQGMLDPWALRNKRWKKALYGTLIERRYMNGAACLRATTPAEVEDYRRFGVRVSKCAVIPMGVDAPSSADASLFYERFPELRDRQLVLFLSRLHYKKGLDLLCRAWAALHGQFPNAHLVLAGPESADTHSSLLQLISKLGIASSVTFTGMVTGDLKWSTFAAATVFVLPTYSENFAVAVSEAMALGRPVIITRQCNRPEVAESRAGWVIEPDTGQLTAAIRNALLMNPVQLDAYGANGRRLINEHYSWTAIGRDMAAVYEWILGMGPEPACVRSV